MALFIGGPLDGRIVEVDPNRNHVEVAIKKPLYNDTISFEEENVPKKSLTDIFYYKRELLNCPTNIFALFVPRSYTCEDVMEALIQGYHQSVHQV